MQARAQAGSARRGFTLVEVLVALLVLAILAALAWQGLAGILRVRDGSGAALDRTLRLNTAVVQWEQDLGALIDAVVVPPLSFNGQTLLLTRRTDAGVVLVAWSVRGGLWQRWAGVPLVRSSDLQQAWLGAQGLLGNEPGHVTAAEGASDWQIYKYIGGARTNMQSSGDIVLPAPVVSRPPPPVTPAGGAPVPGTQPVVSTAGRESLPQALEMVLTLDGRTLTRLIALAPGGGS